MSTVLEQDHFYSVFLRSFATASTNSQNRDDEMRRPQAFWKGRSVAFFVSVDDVFIVVCGRSAERLLYRPLSNVAKF